MANQGQSIGTNTTPSTSNNAKQHVKKKKAKQHLQEQRKFVAAGPDQ
jgi:hypothetical protein